MQFLVLTGTLQPYKETTVSFEVGGNIENMNADIGDIIQTGIDSN